MSMTMVCKGSWLLGTACRKCDRYRDTALDWATQLQRTVVELRSLQLSVTEMAAIWNWHHDCEIAAAGKGDYPDAQWHKERAKAFWRSPLSGTEGG